MIIVLDCGQPKTWQLEEFGRLIHDEIQTFWMVSMRLRIVIFMNKYMMQKMGWDI